MAEADNSFKHNGAPPPLPEPVDTREFIQLLRERAWLIILVTLGAFLIGRWYAYKSPLIYQAKAVLQVEQEIPKLVSSVEEIQRQDLRNSEALNTFVNKINVSSVLLRVIRNDNFATNQLFVGETTNTPSEKVLMRRLESMVEARLRPNTRLIDVTVEHTNPQLAQDLANSVATNFIQLEFEQRLSSTTNGATMLRFEAQQLSNRVERAQQALQAYKERNGTVSFEEGRNAISEKHKTYTQQHTEAESQAINLASDLEMIEKIKRDPEALLRVPSVSQDPAIAALRNNVLNQEANVATLTNKWKPKYPKMIEEQQKLENLRAQLRSQVLQSPEGVKQSYETAKGHASSLLEKLKQVEQQELLLSSNAIPYSSLQGTLKTDRDLYDSVLKRLKEIDLSKSIEKYAVNLVEPAGLPVRPAKPNRPQIMLISILSGLFVSLLFVFISHRFDTSIKTVDEAEKMLSLPVLGAIPIDKSSKVKLSPLVMVNEPHSICAESFRTLRATIGMLGRDSERRIFLFTSAVPAEGKSFSCVNYALCQAQQGQKTLLIDFDLRRPSIASSFGLSAETPGVSDYLLGKDSFANLVRPTQYEHLSLLTAGPKVPNPAEQLTGAWVKQLMAEARQAFDRIIIDTPPLNAISDTLYLLSFPQVICLIVRSGVTPKKAVRRAIETMHRANAHPSGIVLNCLPERSGYGYYYYYSTPDGYRSKGVYGAPSEKAEATR